MRTIQYGDADVVLAGGAEMATTRMGLGGFGQAKALSTRNDSPQEASRPWDKDRDGFVLSDGGGAMVLEELEHARAPRRAHLRRAGRFRHERRCPPHHRAARRRRRRTARHAERARATPR